MPREGERGTKRRTVARVSDGLVGVGLSFQVAEDTDEGTAMELSGDLLRKRRGVAFTRADGEVEIGVEVRIPPETGMVGAPLTSERSLTLLGALSLAGGQQRLRMQLLTDAEGISGVLVSQVLCEERLSPERIREVSEQLAESAERLAAALQAEDLVTAIGDAIRPPRTIGEIAVAEDSDVILAPTFDEEARDRMMRDLQG